MRPPLTAANSARFEANRQRAEWLVAVANGDTTVVDVIEWATTTDGKALLRVPLRKLLLAQPGWGEDRTRSTITKTLAVTGRRGLPTRKATIAWLLDHRAGGKRFQAFCDAVTAPPAKAPWVAFPFTPATADLAFGGAR